MLCAVSICICKVSYAFCEMEETIDKRDRLSSLSSLLAFICISKSKELSLTLHSMRLARIFQGTSFFLRTSRSSLHSSFLDIPNRRLSKSKQSIRRIFVTRREFFELKREENEVEYEATFACKIISDQFEE